jgi:hypothetical protein
MSKKIISKKIMSNHNQHIDNTPIKNETMEINVNDYQSNDVINIDKHGCHFINSSKKVAIASPKSNNTRMSTLEEYRKNIPGFVKAKTGTTIVTAQNFFTDDQDESDKPEDLSIYSDITEAN